MNVVNVILIVIIIILMTLIKKKFQRAFNKYGKLFSEPEREAEFYRF